MNRDETRELAPLYALGVLDAKTALEVEESLRGASPDDQREMDDWREIAALLPEALPQPAPPVYLKGRLLNLISGDTQETPIETAIAESGAESAPAERTVLPFDSRRRAEPKISRWLLAAATVILSFTTAYLFWQNSKLLGERNKLVEEISSWQRQYDSIVSPATKVIEMVGDQAPQANAKLIWDKRSQRWDLYIFDLPKPPSDKDYQLWYVTGDAKISAAVFSTDTEGRTVLKLTLPPEAWKGLSMTAVTLEPKGGSKQPTSTKFYLRAQL